LKNNTFVSIITKGENMKGSISETVRNLVDNTPYIKQMLSKDFLNCSSYAAAVKDQVERTAGKEAGTNSIVMALRRYAAELASRNSAEIDAPVIKYQIVMHTDIFDYNLEKSDRLLSHISELYQKLPSTQREFINFVVGTNEVGIVASEQYRGLVEKAIENSPVLHKEDNLVAFTMVFSGPFLQTPGIIHEAVQRLAQEEINLLELVSTLNELTFIVKAIDSVASYKVLQSFQSKGGKH